MLRIFGGVVALSLALPLFVAGPSSEGHFSLLFLRGQYLEFMERSIFVECGGKRVDAHARDQPLVQTLRHPPSPPNYKIPVPKDVYLRP